MVGSMTYESFSGILVCVVLLAFVLWWFPTRAIRGMKNATRHESDRYSDSMHLIDYDENGSRMDAGTERSGGLSLDAGKDVGTASPAQVPQSRESRNVISPRAAKDVPTDISGNAPKDAREDDGGAGRAASPEWTEDMVTQRHDAKEPAQGRRVFTREGVRRIRAMRKREIRRRRILVSVLFALGVVMAVVSRIVPFPLAYCLIPLGLMAVVLGFGIRASSHARRWEREVAASGVMGHASSTSSMSQGSASQKSAITTAKDSAQASAAQSPMAQTAPVRSNGAKKSSKGSAASVGRRPEGRIGVRAGRGPVASDQDIDETPTAAMSADDIAEAMARTSGTRHGGTPDAADFTDARRRAKVVLARAEMMPLPVAQDDGTDDSPTSTIMSFTLGEPASASVAGSATAEVRSAEIKSYRQVAKAVPERGHTAEIRRAAAEEAQERAEKVREAEEAERTRRQASRRAAQDAEVSKRLDDVLAKRREK